MKLQEEIGTAEDIFKHQSNVLWWLEDGPKTAVGEDFCYEDSEGRN